METQERIEKVCETLKTTLIAKNKNYGNSAFKNPLLAPNVSPREAILT